MHGILPRRTVVCSPRPVLMPRLRPARFLRATAIVLPLLLPAMRASRAQPVITLTRPNATLPHDFSQVRGLRELRDGRVLVTDRLEEQLGVADFAAGTFTVIARPGRGPLEYHLPTTLVPMAGDSTLLTDEGNSRLAVISPALKVVRSFALRLPGIGVPLGARAVDSLGRFYLQIPGWISDARSRADSVWLVRYDPRHERVDTLALIKGTTSPPQRDRRQLGIPFVPFSAQDSWTATLDGRVAIVHASDYHVEWRAPTGAVIHGPPVRAERVAVTAADRIAFTRRFIANSPIGGRDPNGGLSAASGDLLTDAKVREIASYNTFAREMGAFTGVAPIIAPDGGILVERSGHVGAPSTWDEFDRGGRHVRRLMLPAGRRLLGMGRGVAYLVAADEDGLERLERYALPGR